MPKLTEYKDMNPRAKAVVEDIAKRRNTDPAQINNVWKALAKHPALESVTLNQCKEITDAGLAHLAKMKSLRGLHVSNCPKLMEPVTKRSNGGVSRWRSSGYHSSDQPMCLGSMPLVITLWETTVSEAMCPR